MCKVDPEKSTDLEGRWVGRPVRLHLSEQKYAILKTPVITSSC